ncbi:Hypothetical protein R9X50_00715300 [Acrodontium crateriforme]|uniref:Nuclear RNA binding protein n=1 Tax=Acrodontium crateriforme TaxID=150365 RepID=A0AAQ3M9Q2_9PEZI|nr:Hypothetical protein R9X50_00715300 [Acrodontium crateriforme]
MDADHINLSGSKRKRLTDGDPYTASNAHIPKRGRSAPTSSDVEASDNGTPASRRGLRRKKKVNNLSVVSLRQAAEMQLQGGPRESKFSEGSFNDKASTKPPSMFTQMTRTDGGNFKHEDDLMYGYHDGDTTAQDTNEDVLEHADHFTSSHRGSRANPQPTRREESSGFFRFGRSIASNFHPIALWNKLWNESKEELTRQNMEAAARKARLKAEAQAKYALMKQSGQVPGFRTTVASNDSHVFDENVDPHDSGIAMDCSMTSWDDVISRSQVAPPPPPKDNVVVSQFEHESLDSDAHSNKVSKSRFHFSRPSLLNLKKDLKRGKSEYNIASPVAHESSSSLSPTKTELSEASGLKKSSSKFDIRRQYRLSKRVSDLEAKLQQARQELNEALVDASPMPNLGTKYERFKHTPQPPPRPKFVAGQLPSLPSERILRAEATYSGAESEVETNNSLALGSDQGEETIKAPREQDYPVRASSLFKTRINSERESHKKESSSDHRNESINSETNSALEVTAHNPTEQDRLSEPTALDLKFNALNAQVSATNAKPKKRKTGKNEGDKLYKPSRVEEDVDEDEDETPRKRRKGAAKSGKNENSPASVRSKKSPRTKKSASQENRRKSTDVITLQDELAATPPSARPSLDSQGQPLDPVYEEDEEMATIPIKYDPSESTPHPTPQHLTPARYNPNEQLTPARYNPDEQRSSSSPSKKAKRSQEPEKDVDVEATMMTRAALAAQAGRRGRSNSPLVPLENEEAINDPNAIRVIPGLGNIPHLPPNIANANNDNTIKGQKRKRRVGLMEAGDFEWPDDVF